MVHTSAVSDLIHRSRAAPSGCSTSSGAGMGLSLCASPGVSLFFSVQVAAASTGRPASEAARGEPEDRGGGVGGAAACRS